MKIIFDLRNVGLGNNGGSLTLIKSGNTLAELGHKVYFIDYGQNQHTWDTLNVDHIILKNYNQIPDADVLIATGYKSVQETFNAPERCGLKLFWIRAWELWQYSECDIINKILKYHLLKIVNSICLQNKLKEYNFDSTIIRPGYDLHEYNFKDIRKYNKEIILGGLYTKGKHENTKRTKWIFDVYNDLKKHNYKVKLWMFGNDERPNLVDNYIQRPSIKEKELFYNNIDIWLAPTNLEGLHMPPAEAMMNQCCVIGTDAQMSGMQDYLINNKTGIISQDNYESFLYSAKLLYKDKNKRIALGENARKQIEMLGNRKYNMQLLVEYIEEKRRNLE